MKFLSNSSVVGQVRVGQPAQRTPLLRGAGTYPDHQGAPETELNTQDSILPQHSTDTSGWCLHWCSILPSLVEDPGGSLEE